MAELLTYRLSDFILFPASAYYRQFELYNLAVWPAHIVAVLFAAVIIYALWKKPDWTGRVLSLLLVFSWVWVAVVFLYQRFYQIHVVADLYALAFLLQAGLLAWFGLIRDRFRRFADNRLVNVAGSIIMTIAFVIYPFFAVISGRNWLQFEMFALAPDPTALATVGVLLMLRASLLLFVIPVLWLVVSITTQIVM